MTASLLPLPDDPRFELLQISWDEGGFARMLWPRSEWLARYEDLLRGFYPTASSDDITLTARHYAPFPLAAGHERTVRLAYADPPYPGQALRHYGKNGDPFTDPAEVDHAELIAQLETELEDHRSRATSSSGLL